MFGIPSQRVAASAEKRLRHTGGAVAHSAWGPALHLSLLHLKTPKSPGPWGLCPMASCKAAWVFGSATCKHPTRPQKRGKSCQSDKCLLFLSELGSPPIS